MVQHSNESVMIWVGAIALKQGFGGWAFLLQRKKTGLIESGFGRCADTTKDRMALEAVCQAVSQCKKNDVITIVSDLTYLVNGIEAGLRRKTIAGEEDNVDLWQRLLTEANSRELKALWTRDYSVRANRWCNIQAKRSAQSLRDGRSVPSSLPLPKSKCIDQDKMTAFASELKRTNCILQVMECLDILALSFDGDLISIELSREPSGTEKFKLERAVKKAIRSMAVKQERINSRTAKKNRTR